MRLWCLMNTEKGLTQKNIEQVLNLNIWQQALKGLQPQAKLIRNGKNPENKMFTAFLLVTQFVKCMGCKFFRDKIFLYSVMRAEILSERNTADLLLYFIQYCTFIVTIFLYLFISPYTSMHGRLILLLLLASLLAKMVRPNNYFIQYRLNNLFEKTVP